MTMWKVCQDCRSIDEDVSPACRECGSTKPTQEAFLHRTLAEASAASLWLADGYSLCDVKDPYFKPRR